MATIELASDWAEKVRRLTTALDSKAELAKKLRVSPATISLWEKGEHVPQHANIRRIEKLEEKLLNGSGGTDVVEEVDWVSEIEKWIADGWTVPNLADAMGVSKSRMYAWRGGTNPTADGLEALLKFRTKFNGPKAAAAAKGSKPVQVDKPAANGIRSLNTQCHNLQLMVESLPVREIGSVEPVALEHLIGALNELLAVRQAFELAHA